MQKGDTCTIQDIPGFLEVKHKVKYLESYQNYKIWLNRQGFLIGGLTPGELNRYDILDIDFVF